MRSAWLTLPEDTEALAAALRAAAPPEVVADRPIFISPTTFPPTDEAVPSKPAGLPPPVEGVAR